MTRRSPRLALAAVAVALLAAAASGCGSTSKQAATTAASTAPPPAGQQASQDGCTHTAPPAAHTKKPRFAKPGHVLARHARARIVLVTSCGTITVHLDTRRSGPIANSVAFLVVHHFYDGLTFHRVVPGFVIQAGDPLGNGSGGPGYEVVGAPPRRYRYRLGDVAMAKTQVDPRGAAGSQFFIVSGPQGAGLPPDYGLLGHVRDRRSLLTVSRIDALGVGDGPPRAPVYIISARLVRG